MAVPPEDVFVSVSAERTTPPYLVVPLSWKLCMSAEITTTPKRKLSAFDI